MAEKGFGLSPVDIQYFLAKRSFCQRACFQSQSSPGGATGVEGQRDGKFREGKLCCVCYSSVAACNVCVDACACTCGCKCKYDNVHSGMDTCTCVGSSAHSCGCVADGGDAMAAF